MNIKRLPGFETMSLSQRAQSLSGALQVCILNTFGFISIYELGKRFSKHLFYSPYIRIEVLTKLGTASTTYRYGCQIESPIS
jgi:hypothetical protein